MNPVEIFVCALLTILTGVTLWSVWNQERRDDSGTIAPEKYTRGEAADALDRARKIVLEVFKISRGWTVDEIIATVEIALAHSKPEPAPERNQEKEIEVTK